MEKKFSLKPLINEPDSYALVDEDNNIVEKFRLKSTALMIKNKLEKEVMRKLRVLPLK